MELGIGRVLQETDEGSRRGLRITDQGLGKNMVFF